MSIMQYISFPYVALSMALVLATGVFMTSRGQGIYASDTLQEMLLWTGGFIIYAIADYFFLMY